MLEKWGGWGQLPTLCEIMVIHSGEVKQLWNRFANRGWNPENYGPHPQSMEFLINMQWHGTKDLNLSKGLNDIAVFIRDAQSSITIQLGIQFKISLPNLDGDHSIMWPQVKSTCQGLVALQKQCQQISGELSDKTVSDYNRIVMA